MADYAVTVAREWPIIDHPWDGGAAKARVFERYTNSNGELDASSAADFFLIADTSTGLRGDLHMPVGDIVDSERVINASALRAALSRLGQGFPDGVPESVRSRAEEVARAMLDSYRERADRSDSSLTVVFPIPTEIGEQFPHGIAQRPHVTVIYAKSATLEQRDRVAAIVREEAVSLSGEIIRLGPLGHFDNEERVAYASVLVSDAVAAARQRIAQRVSAFLDVSRVDEWTPHATLKFIPPNTAYIGPVPEGEWSVDQLQIWHAGDCVLVTLIDTRAGTEDERQDTIKRAGDKWEVWTEDGSEKLGEYDSEEDARERLRQIEAAKAARADAPYQRELFAPAVHTESRNLIEDVYRFDRAEYLTDPSVDLGIDLDLPATELANGWRRWPVLYSRIGSQKYIINGREVIEHRDAKDVFDPRSMQSGWGVPWELRHSKDLLTPQTVLGVACGTTLTVAPYKDGIHTCGYAHSWDESLSRSIEDRTAGEVSVAFRCKVDPRGGHDDYGDWFDQRQVDIVWNSLASEPKGRAGSARVLASRADASDGVFVDSASTMLALARQSSPGKPVYFDPNCFRRFDATEAPTTIPPDQQGTRTDAMMKFLSLLLQAKGLENAAVAEALGVSEADLVALLDGSAELTDDQMVKLVELVAPRGAMPEVEPEVEAENMDEGMVRTLEERVAMLERAVSDANKRADAAEADVKSRDTKIAGMVTEVDAQVRADAARAEGEAMAIQAGAAMTLAKRALGFDWPPGMSRGEDGKWTDGGERKDADGNVIPVTIADWRRGAILGAFGDDEGAQVLRRLDAAPDAAYEFLMAERLADAAKRLDARDLQCDDLRTSIARTTENAVKDKNRQDAEKKDRVQELIEKQQQAASAVKPRTQGAA